MKDYYNFLIVITCFLILSILTLSCNTISEKKDFKKLDFVLDLFNPQTVIFLGDLFHSKMNIEWNLFANHEYLIY